MKNKTLAFILSFTYFIFIGFSQFSYALTEQEFMDEVEKAKKGSVDAQFNLGLWFYKGTEIRQQDYNKALQMFQLAADQGDAAAQLFLGSIYHKAEGVPQDYKKAIKWYRLSAAQGNAHAQKFLKLAENQLKEEAETKTEQGDTEKAGITEPVITAKVVEKQDLVHESPQKDDFQEVIGYTYSVNCKIDVEFENKLPTTVAIHNIGVGTTKKGPNLLQTTNLLNTDFKRGYRKIVLKPGEKITLEVGATSALIYLDKKKIYQKQIDAKQKTELTSKYGCSSYNGNLHITKFGKLLGPTRIKFKDDIGVKDPFSVIRPLKEGVMPLENTIMDSLM
jgi:hypothetical protein